MKPTNPGLNFKKFILVVFFILLGIMVYYIRNRSYTTLIKTDKVELYSQGTNVSSQYLRLLSHPGQNPRILFIKNTATGRIKIFTMDEKQGQIVDYYLSNYKMRSIPIINNYRIAIDTNIDKLVLDKDVAGYFPDYQLEVLHSPDRMEFNLPVTTHKWYQGFDRIIIRN